VRDKQANVLVVENASCASAACIFILAGGAYRTVRCTLGIHRPFLETPSRTMTPGDIKNIMTKRQEQLRTFLREMNISERLADDMVIPSAQMKWLSPQEIELYGLGVDDPVIHESKILQNARKYGLSRIEYETRWRRVQQLYPFGSDDACTENIMKGLPSPRSTAPR
jgi:hypothetical protein